MREFGRDLRALGPILENLKPVLSHVEVSKIENGWGLLLSLLRSPCVGRGPRRSSSRKSRESDFLLITLLLVSLPLTRLFDRDYVRRSEEHTSELQSRPHLVCRL